MTDAVVKFWYDCSKMSHLSESADVTDDDNDSTFMSDSSSSDDEADETNHEKKPIQRTSRRVCYQ